MKCVWKAPATASRTVILALKSFAIFSTACKPPWTCVIAATLPAAMMEEQSLQSQAGNDDAQGRMPKGRGVRGASQASQVQEDLFGSWKGALTDLATWQAPTDSIVAVAQEVGYPDALLCAHLLIRSLTQLIYLQAPCGFPIPAPACF